MSKHFIPTGERLMQAGLISRDQLELCLNAQAMLNRSGGGFRIGEVILDYGFSSRADVEAAITATGHLFDGLAAFSFPTPLLKRLKAIPIGLNNGVMRVAAAGTLDKIDQEDLISAADDAGMNVGSIEIVPKNRIDVLRSINSLASPDKTTIKAGLAEMASRDDGAFINQMIENVFIDAMQSRASDIHVLSSKDPNHNWIAHRIDGVLNYVYMVDPLAMSVLATRIKSDSGIDYSDTMRPHDGRTSIRYNGKQIDVRVSTLPVEYGEKIVMRLLDSSSVPNISLLFSMHPPVAEQIGQIVATDQKVGGLFLVTGATGSGKSTTLNAILRGMDRSRRAIGTVEDPIELRVPLVGHTQVNEAAGLSYSNVLRALMRQDPDVIMVGELRDQDTVETAMRAAETGHMLLSTLHTDNVAESVNRLVGMMDPGFRNAGKYILAGGLKGVVNQKLARRLCTKCVSETHPDEEAISLLVSALGQEYMPAKFFRSAGCDRCNGTGFFGRVSVPEALFIGSDSSTRSALERLLVNDLPFRDAFTLPGVVWYPRSRAISSVLVAGMIDFTTALALLDMRHGVKN